MTSIFENHTRDLKPKTDNLAVQVAKYPRPLRVLHWLMAAIIISLLTIGLTMVNLDDRVPIKFDVLYPWHKSFGMLILILIIVRLWMRARARRRIPAMPDGIPRWERTAARVSFVLFYALMIAVPAMGYALSSSYTKSAGVFFFGVDLPELLPKNDTHFEVFRQLHRLGAFVLLGLLALHVFAALKHRFLERDAANDVISRMT